MEPTVIKELINVRSVDLNSRTSHGSNPRRSRSMIKTVPRRPFPVSLQPSNNKNYYRRIRVAFQSPTPPQYVFWYHNDHMINYDTARGGITVETVPGPRTQSRLTIRDTNDADSGNYTCSASNTEPASIYVFVSEGRSWNDRLGFKLWKKLKKNRRRAVEGKIFKLPLSKCYSKFPCSHVGNEI